MHFDLNILLPKKSGRPHAPRIEQTKTNEIATFFKARKIRVSRLAELFRTYPYVIARWFNSGVPVAKENQFLQLIEAVEMWEKQHGCQFGSVENGS